MAYFVTFGWTRGYLTKTERDEYHRLSHSVGLSMDHELFTRDMIVQATEAIMFVAASLHHLYDLDIFSKENSRWGATVCYPKALWIMRVRQ